MPNKLVALDNVDDNYPTVIEQSIVTYTTSFEIIAVLVRSLTFSIEKKNVHCIVLHDGSHSTTRAIVK